MVQEGYPKCPFQNDELKPHSQEGLLSKKMSNVKTSI